MGENVTKRKIDMMNTKVKVVASMMFVFTLLFTGLCSGKCPQESDVIPTGAVNGKFTINDKGCQVVFSRGNLQYQASTNTWRFAEHQWNYVGCSTTLFDGGGGGNITGSSNHSISSDYSGWIDLFGWGTSGYGHGSICYQPWSKSLKKGEYYAYGIDYYNLNDSTCQADWGYNPIQNGGNQGKQWRVLSIEEWKYLFSARKTQSDIRFVRANVNSVDGIILFPDDWSSDYYSLSGVNETGGDYDSNSVDLEEWESVFEIHGAVFLPAAGMREGVDVDLRSTGSCGGYWSSTHYKKNYAYCIITTGMYIGIDDIYGRRGEGYSVRLVHDIK